MHVETKTSGKYGIINIIALVVFCFAIGEAAAILLTGLIFNVDSVRIFEILKEPSPADRSLLILFSCFSTLFRFLIIPGLYLFFTNRSSLDFIRANAKVHFTPVLLTVVIVLVLIPCTSLLIDFNNRLALPHWLSELETYFRDGEQRARRLSNLLFEFRDPEDLAIVILIVAVIPGIAEEFLFRGVVQLRLQTILKNHHYAILLSAALFAFFHFQFYGFMPRIALGMLFGYVFYWSGNIRYPVIMHITNNLAGVLGVYFLGPQIMDPDRGTDITMHLVFPSAVVSIMIIWKIRGIFRLIVNR